MTTILGIDPGSRVTGYGIIRVDENNKFNYIDSGCIRTEGENLSVRLLEIFNGIREIMDSFKPDEMAIEQVFMHQNPNSALKLGHARGVAMVACASHLIKIHEYSPREIKQAVVGFGAAKKDQVKHMVVNLLMLSKPPQNDASDALAIAICHSHMKNSMLRKSSKTWRMK